MPKVSVIIPVYNTEKYLRECLDSIVNQTLKDIEIICINDGSTDNSLEILNEYARNDNRITVISKSNEGAATARNIGLELAKGEYLSILDADDIFNSQMLETMYKKAVSTDSDIVITKCKGLNMQTNQEEKNNWSLRYLPNKEIFSYKDFLPNHVFNFCIGWSWDKLYKKEFVHTNNLKFQNLRSTNDAFFVFVSICLARKITVVDKIQIVHRQCTGTQLSETRDLDAFCFINAILAIYNKLIDLDIYGEVEKSFLLWVVEFCFWHLNTLSIQNSEKLLLELNLLFEKLKIYTKNSTYFNEHTVYKILCIKQQNLLAYKNFNIHIKMQKQLVGSSPKSNIEKIFSVTNSVNKTHKVITILGMKIKIKRRQKNA